MARTLEKAKALRAVLFWSVVALLPGLGLAVLVWLVVREVRAVRRERLQSNTPRAAVRPYAKLPKLQLLKLAA